ncbi:hypothetical protein ANME2D_00014 [Candidatus Methanoperedens nitroreducens]|uniref:Uncharacterized protein n=1 Tax=Candidatus Methanoperedens nitratireducens TaxID=1392998 RepID=A0A062V1K4_9EURY|nr:hypothetical protein [Candidatus Methanoperedens nitroreducens]KCZ72956.1 hypothetical protein ANME2D_00014 [Candidatus Methanoperedens nitroreducens]MDJ1423100.1 hypothetical protein [Candidatus Methanoperedens sp.]
MNLDALLSNHKENFRQRVITALAEKNSLTAGEAMTEYKDFIEQYVDDKYQPVQQLADRINGSTRPVLLNIRRDRMREDRCKLCEGNQPNIDQIHEKYGDRIEIIEVTEDRPDGGALYHIIFNEESKEKKLPLTAIINRGEILKFWAGKTVDAAVYERYIKKIPDKSR